VKILYVASDQEVPGRTGGSIHVLEVARGLAARGHEVQVVVHRAREVADLETEGGVVWHRIEWRPRHRFFRFRALRAVAAIAAAFRPDVIIERYYNFGGEGVVLASRLGVPSLLEVNSPIVDHPGSLKGVLDALMLVRPMRSYRESLCRQASALIAPIPEIVPLFAREKTEIVTWGANVQAFHPGRRSDVLRRSLGIGEADVAVLFSGSFRPWHGVHVVEAAARRLRERRDLHFVLVGGGAGGQGDGFTGRRLGSVAYERMPEVVASADIGLAPYDPSRLKQLRLGFYWSPLKIFEYMASGLPTVTIPRSPLTEIVREGVEGLHVPPGSPEALAAAVAKLADDAPLRARMGASARARVVERYSWERHCEQIEAVLRRIVG
jgi:glycosyltransferase involved in cell wall biosynthesis